MIQELVNVDDFKLMALSATFKLFVALLAFAGVRIGISNMDKAFGINSKGWVNDASDLAKSLYFGLRMIGVCILFGYIFA